MYPTININHDSSNTQLVLSFSQNMHNYTIRLSNGNALDLANKIKKMLNDIKYEVNVSPNVIDVTSLKIQQAIRDKESVHILYTDETGEDLYSVVLESDKGFWLNAFKTFRDAEDFCKLNKLPIMPYIED